MAALTRSTPGSRTCLIRPHRLVLCRPRRLVGHEFATRSQPIAAVACTLSLSTVSCPGRKVQVHFHLSTSSGLVTNTLIASSLLSSSWSHEGRQRRQMKPDEGSDAGDTTGRTRPCGTIWRLPVTITAVIEIGLELAVSVIGRTTHSGRGVFADDPMGCSAFCRRNSSSVSVAALDVGDQLVDKATVLDLRRMSRIRSWCRKHHAGLRGSRRIPRCPTPSSTSAPGHPYIKSTISSACAALEVGQFQGVAGFDHDSEPGCDYPVPPHNTVCSPNRSVSVSVFERRLDDAGPGCRRSLWRATAPAPSPRGSCLYRNQTRQYPAVDELAAHPSNDLVPSGATISRRRRRGGFDWPK